MKQCSKLTQEMVLQWSQELNPEGIGPVGPEAGGRASRCAGRLVSEALGPGFLEGGFLAYPACITFHVVLLGHGVGGAGYHY